MPTQILGHSPRALPIELLIGLCERIITGLYREAC